MLEKSHVLKQNGPHKVCLETKAHPPGDQHIST